MGTSSLRRVRSPLLPLIATVILAAQLPGAAIPKAGGAQGAIFVVTNTSDAGEGSLRRAILDANQTPEMDFIVFAIPGDGVRTIAPASPLPVVEAPVTIDGTTQLGFAGTPIVELDGRGAGEGVGLCLDGGGITVRGLVVNGFPSHGIELVGGGHNRVEGNYVGTDATGTVGRPNGEAGVFVNDSSENVVGGTSAEARNLVSGNAGDGVFIEGAPSTGNLVAGNYVGTDAAGTSRLGNGLAGIIVQEAPGNVVSGNVVSGNGYEGVSIEGVLATGNAVLGNTIGPGADGRTEIGNTFAGVVLEEGASGNTVGGSEPGAGNVVAFNLGDGVEVAEGRANRIAGNAIFSNRGIGITLGGREIGMNDEGDADTGQNDLQNYPVLRTAASDGETTTVTGELQSLPATAFRLEFFASAECDPYGFGEGAIPLGTVDVVTGGEGVAGFTATLPAAAAFVSATATDPEGNTSEFSSCVRVDLSWDPPDFGSGDATPPPRNLSVTAAKAGQSEATPVPRGSRLVGYRVYGSTRPGAPPSSGTLLTSVPPTQTTATVPAGPGGSFFVVTALYEEGESGPSNEADGGRPPLVTSVKVKSRKIVANGSLFTDSVLVIVDGLPFVTPAKVKKRNSRVTQSGLLVTGQTLSEYLESLRPREDGTVRVLLGFRNATGGVATVEHRFSP